MTGGPAVAPMAVQAAQQVQAGLLFWVAGAGIEGEDQEKECGCPNGLNT